MKIVAILAMLAMLGVASAETIQFGNYTATFDMKQLHIVSDGKIKTYDGCVSLWEYTGLAYPNFEVGQLNISGYNADFRVYLTSNTSVWGYRATLPDISVGITSTMNLTSTLDFLKILKIEKRKRAA